MQATFGKSFGIWCHKRNNYRYQAHKERGIRGSRRPLLWLFSHFKFSCICDAFRFWLRIRVRVRVPISISIAIAIAMHNSTECLPHKLPTYHRVQIQIQITAAASAVGSASAYLPIYLSASKVLPNSEFPSPKTLSLGISPS